MAEPIKFPAAKPGHFDPVNRFRIPNGRYVDLYRNTSRPESSPYSLRWEDTDETIQHGCSINEVFNILEYMLEDELP